MTKTYLILGIVVTLAIIIILSLLFWPRPAANQPSGPVPSPVVPISTPAARTNPDWVGAEPADFQNAQLDWVRQTPLLQILPFNEAEFSVEYIDEQHLVVTSNVSDKEAGYQAARDWFKQNGVDLNKIQVDYK